MKNNGCSMESFIEKCKADKSIQDKNKILWDDLFEKQSEYGTSYVPGRKFKWWKLSNILVCPRDGQELIDDRVFIDNKYIYYILSCACGYKYAYKDYRLIS